MNRFVLKQLMGNQDIVPLVRGKKVLVLIPDQKLNEEFENRIEQLLRTHAENFTVRTFSTEEAIHDCNITIVLPYCMENLLSRHHLAIMKYNLRELNPVAKLWRVLHRTSSGSKFFYEAA